MKLKDFYNQKRKDWYLHDDVDMESAKEQFGRNIEALKHAEEWREQEGRPITICVMHGSGRHPTVSCANEMSSSEMLLERGLELAKAELDEEPIVWTYKLREMMLEPCNGCVSTASSLCNFPCSCFPGDDISTKIYPAVMAADILLLSTPVNQSMISTRLKTVIDRLVAIDGGYFIEKLPVKNQEWRDKMIQLSQEQPVYDQRMFGRIAGYFVTSKDVANTHQESAPYVPEFKHLGYKEFVVGALAHQGTEYGWFHGDPFYVVAAADPDVEYSLDKDHYDQLNSSHEEAKDVVLAAIELARKFRDEPPKFTSAGRVNRT